MPSDATEAALGLLGLNAPFPPPSSVPAKRKQSPSADDDITSSESINCICGISLDDGFSIGCDSCSRWCHAACFNIVENEVPEEWQCWICAPRPVDKDTARRIQKGRQRLLNKRKPSPGVDRKPRRPTAAPTDTKRKRRASINNVHEDEHIDIEELCYVPISKDVVSTDDARDRLRRIASQWRGVSAIDPSPPSLSTTPGCTTPVLLIPDAFPSDVQVSLQPVASSSIHFANGDPSVRPPSFAVHAAKSIESSKLIAPYPSTIIPTATYLRDPLNAYAHLGMPKPYVHLFGPPLDVALDTRISGDRSRFVRNGCRPNAILRPIFCESQKSTQDEEDAVRFGIFALRDLKAHEEVVLGWEWDDGNVVHHLPAFIKNSFAFPPHQLQHFRNQMTSMLHTLASTFTTCACGANSRDCVLSRIADFVENQTPLTPSPSPPSQFSKDKHAASGHGRSEPPEDGPVDLGPLIGIERGFRTRERIPSSGGLGGVELVSESSEPGPSRLSTQLGSRKVFPDAFIDPISKPTKRKDWKGKGRADEENNCQDEGPQAQSGVRHGREAVADHLDTDGPLVEERLPPKLRKVWIAKNAERLREHPPPEADHGHSSDGTRDESYIDSRDMPPPPVAPLRTPPLLSASSSYYPPLSISASTSTTSTTSTTSACSSSAKPPLALDGPVSPSLSFSKLSLLSPVVPTHTSTSTKYVADTSPSGAPKAKRRRASSQLSLDSDKSTKSTKSKGKEQGGRKLKDKVKVGKERVKVKSVGKETPRTPVTNTDDPMPKPTLLRRESIVGNTRARSHSFEAVRSPSTSVTSVPFLTPTPPPSLTSVIVAPDLPYDTGEDAKPSVADLSSEPEPLALDKRPQLASDGDRMEVDRSSSPNPLSVISVPVSALPDLSHDVSPSPAVEAEHATIAEDSTLTPSPESLRGRSSPTMLSLTASADVLTSPVPSAPTHTICSGLEPAPPSIVEPSVGTMAGPQAHIEGSTAAIIKPRPRVDNESAHKHAVQREQMAGVSEVSPPAPDDPQRALSIPPDSMAVSPYFALRSPPASTSQSELPLESDIHAAPLGEAAAEQTHAPPVPPKVKLSLKDFALRKRKQREEQMERKKEESEKTALLSPQMLSVNRLLDEFPVGSSAGEVAEADSKMEQQRPVVEIEGEGAGSEGVGMDGEGDAKMTEVGKRQDHQELEAEQGRVVKDLELLAVMTPGDEHKGAVAGVSPSLASMEDLRTDSIHPEETAREVALAPTASSPDFGQHYPEAQEDLHFYRRMHSPVYDYDRTRRHSDDGFNADLEMTETLQAKMELMDNFVPNGLVASARDMSPMEFYSLPDSRNKGVDPITPPRISPKLSHSRAPVALHSSHEDGEIFSPPSAKPTPLAPRSHSPPTHPRLFFANGGVSPSRRSPPSPPARRPLQPTQYARPRMVPNAPRALRGERSSYAPSGMYSSGGGQNAPYFAPRGPSADRERERGRDWGGRERDGDRDRAWIPGPSRGRGRGTWGR